MAGKLDAVDVLKKIDVLEQELIKLKRDVLHSLVVKEKLKKTKPSLFGRVRSGDITEVMIEKSKKNLFRDVIDL